MHASAALSVGVPGTVATWVAALHRYGTMSLADVLQPGIHVARHGYVIDQTWFDQANGVRDWLDDIPASAALFLDPDRTPRDVGTVFTNPDLATTYERIGHLGLKGFYRGAIADALVDAVDHPPVSPTANHLFSAGCDDDARPALIRRSGATTDTFELPRSRRLLDGTTVKRRLDRGRGIEHPRGLPALEHDPREAFHYYLEASRYSFADRNAYLADPAYFDVPLSGLLSKDYATTRRDLISPTAADPPIVQPGNPYPYVTGQAAATVTQSETTTHLVTSDSRGNVVSYTFTIESTGGSALVVPRFGFLLNNELTDFNFDSQTHPNRVEGGKRPRSSMSPTIVLDHGQPFLALGSPGGSTIITTVLQILFDRLDEHMSLPDAIADPRASQRNTTRTSAEPAFIASPLATLLLARGHQFVDAGEIGAATGLEFLADGRVLAAAEPVRRGGGSAMVEFPE